MKPRTKVSMACIALMFYFALAILGFEHAKAEDVDTVGFVMEVYASEDDSYAVWMIENSIKAVQEGISMMFAHSMVYYEEEGPGATYINTYAYLQTCSVFEGSSNKDVALKWMMVNLGEPDRAASEGSVFFWLHHCGALLQELSRISHEGYPDESTKT